MYPIKPSLKSKPDEVVTLVAMAMLTADHWKRLVRRVLAKSSVDH